MIQTDGTLEEIFGSIHIEILHTDGHEEYSGIDIINNINNNDDDETLTSDKENDDFQTNHKQTTDKEQFKEELAITNEELLTQNIARVIYEEAKNVALSKIGQDYQYHSDQER